MLFSELLTNIFKRPKTSYLSVTEVPDEKRVMRRSLVSSFDDARLLGPSVRSKPSAIYDGGYEGAEQRGIYLRIANGGAGQTGLIHAWADAFIRHMVINGADPFQIAWYLGDTTESLALLASGEVDVAVTYNPAAESELIQSGDATESIYVFRDHFLLVGPKSNPANLSEDDDILTMFSKIVSCGNADITSPPTQRQPTRFLSRFDKSATNIKESLIFATIGQVPWALDCSKWYHQYPRFPKEALEAAASLSEYTLSDKGAWLDASDSVTSHLKIFKIGSNDPNDLLLNPAHALRGKRVPLCHQDICRSFMQWLAPPDGGQKVVGNFKKNGRILYSKAP